MKTSKLKKRSSIEAATLVLLIILIASITVLAGVVVMYTKLATKDARKKACEFDITKAVLSKKLPDFKKLFTRGHKQTSLNNCRRDKLGNLEIKYNDIVENGAINQDKAHEIIADEMAECWKMVGGGATDFSDPFSDFGGKGESYCIICSTIKFDDRLMKLYQKGVKEENTGEKDKTRQAMSEEDFNKYRIGPIHPYLISKELKKGLTYWKFLYNEESIEYKDKEPYSFIPPDSTIIIQMHKLESKEWIVYGVGLGTLLLTGEVMLAAPTMGYSLVLGVLGKAIFAAQAAVIVNAGSSAYKECEECNAIGGVQLVPPEQEFDIEIHTKLEGKEKKIPLCSIIVN